MKQQVAQPQVLTLARVIEAIGEAVEVVTSDYDMAINALNASSYRDRLTHDTTISVTVLHAGAPAARPILLGFIDRALQKSFGPAKAKSGTFVSMTWVWSDGSTATVVVLP